ncbi:uncharacterized protein LOC113498174 [Trichoplusia ni]|uniref:Uncharacterized protein LOC113498174 n=1 Tax=Trichoplusia ni TaxID=7111 RepID=A0A7E5W0T0_TRINI|nr:uncharacterized protein LOC113498174 [Trichoplusia ni]
MPTTRSGSTQSKTAGNSSSSDWSMHTPSDTASSAATSIASMSTLTKRTPTTSPKGSRAPVPQSKDATRRESTSAEAVRPAPLTHAAAKEVEDSNPARQEGSHTTLQNPIRSVGIRTSSREGTLQQPDPGNLARDRDTMSARSSHRKRAEAQARLTVALREQEMAETRLRVAQAQLELVAAESEDEDGAGEEIYERTHEVEQWFIQTSAGSSKEQRPVESQDKKSDIQKLAEAIGKLSRNSRDVIAPKYIELPYFNGACEEWLAFRRTYEDTAASFSAAQNLARLRRAIQGKAKEAVQSLLFTAEKPHEVIKGLESRFGRPGALALAELEKLKNLSKVSESPGEICVFASRVKNAIETIKALKKPQYLSSPETLKAIVDKMPPTMKFRWFAYHRGRRDEDIQELLLIEDFLDIEADMCGDFAPPEVPSDKKSSRRPVHTVQEESQDKKFKKSCPVCEEEHFATECKKFKEASIDKKWDIIKKAKICFKCLRFKHLRSNCKAPVCRKCRRWHHTILHSDKPEVQKSSKEGASEEKVASVHNNKDEDRAYLKIVPVQLYGPKGQVRVLALLDEGSTVTLLDASIAEKIGAAGSREALTIETVGGKVIRKDSSQKINLKIKGVHRRDKKTITVRTIDDLKLSEQRVNRSTVKNCLHLKTIKRQLLYDAERPKLLIGQDNWGLIVTRRLKKGKPTEPVASLTYLGWVLHGCETGSNAVVNFMHYGRATSEGEDIEEVVREHFQLESLGIQNRLPSNDSDRRALETLEKTTKRLPSGQFEAGLLWKKEGETLPNNYNQAFRRLVNIEKKLDREEDVKEYYEKQIQTLIENGYAEKAPVTTTKGKTFYLPHFAVVHPVKRKPRIVFDAAAKYEGRSLNDALLAGPDLLQSLFGVLLRFREGPVAVMADIQDMFLRVKVKEEDRDCLRFLWRGSRRTGKPEEYRMSSIIFGAASSSATAIYVMNRNETEDFKITHPEAVKAIRRNHNVDDYLQSFSSTAEAKKILREVKEINLKARTPLENTSKLKKIDVYIGDEGDIKLRSRTMKFRDGGLRKINPVILDGRQRIAQLIIRSYHEKFLHGNTATVMNEVRQKYWILGLRATLKAVAHGCQWCKLRKSTPAIPPAGDLPSERLQHHQFPFACTAVDYFGPMQVTIGRRVEKRWVALFTCLTTRAVHLELAPSLSASSMIMALRRMAARRGTPRTLFSDNGTNFVGANKELEAAALEKGIKWKFIPPGSPNMGGAWERLVRTVKTALAVVLNERSPPEEVLHTLMTEVEHIVNSRPLTPVSMDPNDAESLTPNHFLLGRSCGAMAPGEFEDTELVGKATWRTAQRLADHFWRRWVKEYLPLLMPRKIDGRTTVDPREGDVVLIVDAALPRNSWPRGEVIKVYPGPDGRRRVLDVRTSGGVLRRPTRRVVVLVPAAASSHPEDGVLRTAGENVSDDDNYVHLN